jgi:site-specific recombinase XerD
MARRPTDACSIDSTKPAACHRSQLHDLRHGVATLALAAGIDMNVVQEMLGHSSIVLTSDTYSSVLPQVAADAAERVAQLVPRRSGASGHAMATQA